MAEGLDDVAGLFTQEIAPQSRPRDQAGKFVVTTSKPESMFGERPVEGDPMTGDTRDGGDNERLRQIERDVADGRRDRRREPEDAEVQEVEQDPEQVASTADDDDEPGQDVTA